MDLEGKSELALLDGKIELVNNRVNLLIDLLEEKIIIDPGFYHDTSIICSDWNAIIAQQQKLLETNKPE